jgi:hypothetical protein
LVLDSINLLPKVLNLEWWNYIICEKNGTKKGIN